MTANLIDGRSYATSLEVSIEQDVKRFREKTNVTPGLAVILVGNDPASEVYVRNKAVKTQQLGMSSSVIKLPENISQERLLQHIDELNKDKNTHGILIQLPLPKHIDSFVVLNAIAPQKDVDGLGLVNAGYLSIGRPNFIPCTPLGCLLLLKHYLGNLVGQHAVVIGASNLVGKPMGLLLLAEGCTVSTTHIQTRNITRITNMADILIVATGCAHLVREAWVKPGVTIIDVGITRKKGSDGKNKLVGDVAFDEVKHKARYITPVPGGVGPMTIACLLRNTLQAAQQQILTS